MPRDNSITKTAKKLTLSQETLRRTPTAKTGVRTGRPPNTCSECHSIIYC